MDNEKFQELVLQQFQAITGELKALIEGQKDFQKDVQGLKMDVQGLKSGQGKLQKDVTSIKTELGYVWDDVKKLDSRLSAQGEELVILKRLK